MNDVINNLYTLFDAAWKENMNGNGTDITRMVTSFIPDTIQNLQALRDEYDSLLIAYEQLHKIVISRKNNCDSQ